jgi:hypothetical protein
MAYLQKLLPEALESVAFGSITTSYTTLATLAHPTRIVRIVNNTNGLLLISWNGDASTDNDVLPANSFVLYDVTANKVEDDGCFLAKGVIFSVKYSGSAPTSGSIYLVSLYTLVK